MICMASIKLVRSTCHPRHHHHHSYHLPWMERKVDIFKIDLPSGHTFLRIFKTIFFINSIFRVLLQALNIFFSRLTVLSFHSWLYCLLVQILFRDLFLLHLTLLYICRCLFKWFKLVDDNLPTNFLPASHP